MHRALPLMGADLPFAKLMRPFSSCRSCTTGKTTKAYR